MDDPDVIGQRKARAEHWTREAMYTMGSDDTLRASLEAFRHLTADDDMHPEEAIELLESYRKGAFREWSARKELDEIVGPPPYVCHGKKHLWCWEPRRTRTVEW